MRLLYEQKNFPVLQNRVYDNVKDAIDCPKGDIVIVEDEKTGLVFNSAFNPNLMVYDERYNNEQGFSPSFKKHLESVADLVEEVLGRDRLIEVGCGKGFFLEMLLARGIGITGFDSAYEGANPRIEKRHFGPRVITSPAKGLILRHVLEHISNPYEFLLELKAANQGEGLIYIEVPCFDWILQKRAWFDIFYEHVNYFRLIDFERMFGRILRKGWLFGGQYLYVVADLMSLRSSWFEQSSAIDLPTNFMDDLRVEADASSSGYVWGSASKGVIFSLLRQRMNIPLEGAIDINPAKQGRYLPATGLEVISPERAFKELPEETTIYVMNSNYLSEIKEMSQNKFHYVGID